MGRAASAASLRTRSRCGSGSSPIAELDPGSFAVAFPPNRLAAFDVFLSYNWRDESAARRIDAALRAAGLAVFLDRVELSPGQDWLPRLEAALRDCRAVTVLCGPSGFGAWQAREVQLAFDRRSREPEFPIVPVLLRGSDPPLGFLALETWIDLREPSREAPALRDLAQALRNERHR